MRATRILAAAALAATAFVSTPASAHHGEPICHGDDDFWIDTIAGVDNPTRGDNQGVVGCVYAGGGTILVGIGDDTSNSPHHCLTAYYAVGSLFLGCYL